MSHHGRDNEELESLFNDKLQEFRPKEVDQYPDGKITPGDEGQIKIEISAHDGKILVDFGTSIKWIGFTPEQAIEVGQCLIQQATEQGQRKTNYPY